ncbi:MAG: hypothetical protein ABIW17_07695 [Marmoricola sp.]
MALHDLTFLLAGPMVRRVEPTLVSVWVVTSTACTVGLHVWPGGVSAGSGTGPVFDPGGEAARGSRPTLRIGSRFHVAVVTAEVSGNQSLLPGARYSYNVSFAVPGQDPQDLHSLGLLRDRPTQPALGYLAGTLPGFATCPLAIDDLVLLHGSCNRIDAAGGPNLMFAIDEMVHDSLAEPAHRPHQLWLSGDQVYSDEIASVLSPHVTELGRQLLGTDEFVQLIDGTATPLLPVRQTNFPAGYRHDLMRDQAKLTSSEAASHLIGMTERLAMQLLMWSPEVWQRTDAGDVQLSAAATVLPTKEPPLGSAPDGLFGPGDPTVVKQLLVDAHNSFSAREHKVNLRKAEDEAVQVLAYAAKVGVIRRALANVPTYMVFDDHDVTDDWNICQLWKDRVYGTPLGRSVVRDGLTAFALTQGWGNDPRAYDSGPGAEILSAASQLFPDGAAAPLPDPNATDALDRLLGLAGQPPVMRWHYVIDGAAHRVIACDTRTRRGFTGPVSPPVQLPDGERELQIPAGPLPAGLEVLIVVLSQPLLDPVLLGELTQGLISRGAAAFGSIKDKMLNRVDAKGVAGLETLDYEGWGARPAEIPRLLDHLATYPRVVIMSGDVHFSVSLGLSFWRGQQGLVSVIGQFTSSAVQYITFPEALLPALGQGWASQLAGSLNPSEYLVWSDPPDTPVKAPALAERDLRRRLLHRPVIVPTTGWPQATETHIAPDFAYRVDLLADERPDEVRPEPVRAGTLPVEFDDQDPLHGENGYAGLARRHSDAVHRHAHTRRIGVYNKVARITFLHADHTDEPVRRLVVRSELMSIDHYNESPDAAAPFTTHELEFDQPSDALAPRIR